MQQGYKLGMNKMLFAASPTSLKGKRKLGHQLSGQTRYTRGTALRTPPAAASRYAQKARRIRALVVLGDSLGLGGKGCTVRVGKRSADERVNTWVQQQNRRTKRLLIMHN